MDAAGKEAVLSDLTKRELSELSKRLRGWTKNPPIGVPGRTARDRDVYLAADLIRDLAKERA